MSHRLRRGHGVGDLGLLPGVVVQKRQPIVRHQASAQISGHAAQQQLVVPQPDPQALRFQLRVRERKVEHPVPAYRHGQQQQFSFQSLVQRHAAASTALLQAPGRYAPSILQQQSGQIDLPQIAAQDGDRRFHTHPPSASVYARGDKKETPEACRFRGPFVSKFLNVV